VYRCPIVDGIHTRRIVAKREFKKGEYTRTGLRNQATGARDRFTSTLGQIDNVRHLKEGQD
jgi:hypothetical protein